MAVAEGGRGPLWVDGRITVRVRGLGTEPSRLVRLRRPFALVGRLPGADIRIDDPAVDDRHAFLILDRRGVFGVDLLTRSGTRFAGAAGISARLGAGDIFEVAGRCIELVQLRVDGIVIDPPLSDDDPLAEADPSSRVALTLEPLGAPGPPWMLGSSLAFVGRGDACAIRSQGASETHRALIRGDSTAYVVDLLGQSTQLNGRLIEGASALLDGDVLALNNDRFTVRIEPPGDALPNRLIATDEPQVEILEALRRFQADASAIFRGQDDRIEALGREVAALREELRLRRAAPDSPAEPLRLELAPRLPSESAESAAWLLERLTALEPGIQSPWRGALGRIVGSARPRTVPETPLDPHS